MSLYRMHTTDDGMRITKLDDDLNPKSSYLTSSDACQCPAGHRDTCRHRQMLPLFSSTNRINTKWLYDYDTRKWYILGKVLEEQPSWRRV
jgi:hypothetical protein